MDNKTVEEKKIIFEYFSKTKLKNLNKDCYLVKDEITYTHLHPKDHFGGRVLINNEKTADLLSKFTIIAKSAKVEVLIITKGQLSLLSEPVMRNLRNFLEKNPDVDCPKNVSSDEIKKMFIDWQNFKNEIIENIRIEKYSERKKNNFYNS